MLISTRGPVEALIDPTRPNAVMRWPKQLLFVVWGDFLGFFVAYSTVGGRGNSKRCCGVVVMAMVMRMRMRMLTKKIK